MAMFPVRPDPAPLIPRPATARARAQAEPESSAGDPPLDDPLLATALAKVKTPEDQELAQQQAAFDRAIAAQAESERESNAIRELEMAQLKHEDEFMKKWIALI